MNMGKNAKMKNLKFIDSALINDATYYDYLQRMKMVVLSMFEWVNLPDGMDARYLEKCLYYKGMASLIKTEEYGYLNTQCTSNGYMNIYGLPSSLNCMTYNGLHWYKDLYTKLAENDEEILKQQEKECILVLNDMEGIPTCSTIELFARRLYECERACDVNVKSMKTPVMIVCSDNQRLTMENLYSQYDGNQPFIFADKNSNINPDSLKAIKTDAPYVADKLINYKKEIWNEFLTYIGVNNISIEKAERLITAEASQNNELINLYLQNHLAPRQRACKQFNDLFGLTGTDKEISIRVRSDLHNVIKNAESIIADYQEELIDNEIKEDLQGGESNE
jgi:hypothetical protein